MGEIDSYILRNNEIGEGCPGDYNPSEYVLYSEMEFGALLQVAGDTKFINDDRRNNQRVPFDANDKRTGSPHETTGYISGLVGARFEIDNAMKALHLFPKKMEAVSTDFHNAVHKVRDKLARADFGRIKGVNRQFV
ncbi:MAG: DUF4804 domain-containing protein [Pseudomonadota bacterium]|nr:DUF4804 domain-containing protein [Pseudomonadota bacterium]